MPSNATIRDTLSEIRALADGAMKTHQLERKYLLEIAALAVDAIDGLPDVTRDEIERHPGPWFAYAPSPCQTAYHVFSAGLNGRVIAHVMNSKRGVSKDARGNAKLIAAAPELLSALIELVRGCPDRRDYEHAEQAIKKAGG